MARYRRSKGRQQPTQPIILVSKHANQLIVKESCTIARHQGVRNGIPLPLAKALCPEAQTFLHNPLKDYLALERLALRALKFAPFVGIDSDLAAAYKTRTLDNCAGQYWGLIFDISGTEKLYKGERPLAERLLARCGQLSIPVRIGVAATIGAAWALSRFGNTSVHIVPPQGCLKEALADLPLQALRLPRETMQALHALGLRAIADILKLPSKQLALRFGMLLLKRLDQAFGAVDETFTPADPPEVVRAFKRFEVPLTNQQTIQTATLFLFQHIFRTLLAKKRKAGAFVICIDGKDETYRAFRRSKELFLNTSTKNFQHISSVLGPVIEQLLVPGGIHALTVIARDVERAYEEQSDFLSPADLHVLLQSSDEFLNSLMARLGNDHVTLVSFQNSHIPEKSFSYEPLAKLRKQPRPAELPKPLSLGRPPYLFKRPEPITALAMLPDKAPARLYWKGDELTVLQADGPERIAPEWWHLQSPAVDGEREYFKLQDQHGRWLWVYRERESLRWFVQGLWT